MKDKEILPVKKLAQMFDRMNRLGLVICQRLWTISCFCYFFAIFFFAFSEVPFHLLFQESETILLKQFCLNLCFCFRLQLWAYYNGPKFICLPVSVTGLFSYKIWTKNSKTPMVNLFKNLRPFRNYILKIQCKIHFLTFFKY